LVYYAKHFVLNARSIIEIVPLQIYCSALIFSPGKSRIKRQFWDQAPLWIKNTPVVPADWNPSLQSLEGHSGAVYTVAFLPDSQLLASASDDNTVRLWDPSTGASRGTLQGHSGSVNTVAFSPDSQLLASASEDNTVRLWDPSTGASCGTLEGHSGSVNSVVFSSDIQLLASASEDNTVRLWDPSTGASRGTLEGHSDLVQAVAFSPDSQLLASASFDNTVRLWDPSTGASRGTLEGHSGSVFALAFSSDSQLLASASLDNTVRLWDIKSKKEVQILVTEEPSYNLSFSSNGDYLETDRGTIELKNLPHRNERSQSIQLYPLYVSGSWVTVRTENILWLPPDYRPRYMAVRNNVLAIGTSLGRVIFIEIDPDTVPLGGLFRIPLTVEDLIPLQHQVTWNVNLEIWLLDHLPGLLSRARILRKTERCR
jgi:uncharacterized protein with WD repeat